MDRNVTEYPYTILAVCCIAVFLCVTFNKITNSIDTI